MTVAQTLVDDWMTDLITTDRSPHTIRAYTQVIKQFLIWYEAEAQQALQLADLTPIVFVSYRNYLQRDQGKAISTVNIHVAALRTWGAWLTAHQYLPHNPAAHVRSVGRPRAIAPQGLTHRQINALLRASQRVYHPTRAYAIIQMLLQTGMRSGECAALHYGDIAFGQRSGTVHIRTGKRKTARVVPLNRSARTALVGYVAPLFQTAPTLRAVATHWATLDRAMLTQPLWHSRRSAQLSVSAMRRLIDTIVKHRATQHVVPRTTSAHTLRHTFAMHYLAAYPGDVIGLATLLGHTSLETTRIYGHPTQEQLTQRVERIDLNAYEH